MQVNITSSKNKSGSKPLANSVLIAEGPDTGMKSTKVTEKTSYTMQKNKVAANSRPKSGV